MGGRALGTDKDVEALARKARKAGFTVEITRGNHIRWTAPDGTSRVTALTGGRATRRKVAKWLTAHGYPCT